MTAVRVCRVHPRQVLREDGDRLLCPRCRREVTRWLVDDGTGDPLLCQRAAGTGASIRCDSAEMRRRLADPATRARMSVAQRERRARERRQGAA